MKKYILLFFIAVSFQTLAVSPDSIRTMKVGDRIPDLTLNYIINYHVKSARLSELAKDKLLILDFWSTWCLPCVRAFPKIDSLQKKFKNEVLFMPVTWQEKGKIEPFMAKVKAQKSFDLPTAIDTVLYKYFLDDTNARGWAGQYVWIVDGVIVGYSGGSEALNERNINEVLKGNPLPNSMPPSKRVLPDDFSKPLLSDNNSEGRVKFASTVTGYLPALETNIQSSSIHDSVSAVRIVNNSLFFIYQYAYHDLLNSPSYVILELSDPKKFKPKFSAYSKEKDTTNLYCYEKIAPKMDFDTFHRAVQHDLEDLFGYRVSRQVRNVKCAVLKTNKGYKLHHTDTSPVFDSTPFYMIARNQQLSTILLWMRDYLKGKNIPYIINETGIAETTNVSLEVTGDLSDVNVWKTGLEKWGIELTVEQRPMEMSVISDSTN